MTISENGKYSEEEEIISKIAELDDLILGDSLENLRKLAQIIVVNIQNRKSTKK